MVLTDTEGLLDMRRLRAYRLERLRAEMRRQDVGGLALLSPYSMRYATGFRDGAVMQNHIPLSYLFVGLDDWTVLFGGDTARSVADGLETIDTCGEEALHLSYMFSGTRIDQVSRAWVDQMGALMGRHGGGSKRIAVEPPAPQVERLFQDKGFDVIHAAHVTEPARAIKSPEEVLCMNHAIAVAEAGMWRMRKALEPGVSEIELWALLWQANLEAGGDWIEGRLLASGDRTNPWLQEASSRRIRPGELLAFDTDMVGPFGYSADVSRTFFCGPGTPSGRQKELYQRAHEEIQHNLELMRPGMSFREISENGFVQAERFQAQHYAVMAHGIGMSDEWPCIYYPQDGHLTYDGELLAGMTLCVESYVGEVGAAEGVKLEEQILITDRGYELLSRFPFEEDFFH